MKPLAPRSNIISRRALLAAGGAVAFAPGAALAQGGARIEWPALRMLDGSTLRAAEFNDTAALVVFWATHCPFCKRHNVHVDKLHRTLGRRALRVLGVALDSDAQLVRDYMRSNGYGFPVALDGEGLRQRLGLRRVIPATLPIGRDGRMGKAVYGEMFEEDLMEIASGLAAA